MRFDLHGWKNPHPQMFSSLISLLEKEAHPTGIPTKRGEERDEKM